MDTLFMSELSDYIALFAKALEDQNSIEFQKCITINPPLSIANIRRQFPEPTEIDLYHISEKYRPVLISHLKLMKAVYNEKSLDLAFDSLNELIKNLIRASSFQTNWINEPLIQSLKDLVAVYNTIEKKHPEDLDSFIDDGNNYNNYNNYNNNTEKEVKKSCLERLVLIFRDGFTLAFGDKNDNPQLNKKRDIYFFLANLIKYSLKLGNLDGAKSSLLAVKQQINSLPSMDSSISCKKYGITCLYYQALMALDNGNFIESETSLDKALELMSNYSNLKSKQFEQILIILIPLKLYNKGKWPLKKIWLKYPNLRVLYRDNFLKAIKQGNIAKFDESLEKFQLVLLKKHLYILIELLRELVYLRLIHKTYDICYQLNQGDRKHIVAVNAFQLAIEYSTYHTRQEGDFNFSKDHLYNTSLSEVEYIFGNLVFKGKIKGYIHRALQRIVFGKDNPFPHP